MKALVIGATGLVGKQLISELLARREFSKIIVFGRRKTGIVHPKLKETIVNFNQPENWEQMIKGDVLFSCLGTTLKKAGSKQNQYRVDYTFQYVTAAAAANNKVSHYVLVSSAGANANSRFFYTRVKGELEEAVLQLPFKHITILRPSLLTGKRNDKRPGEVFAQQIMPFITRFVFRKYRPISDGTVALAMVNAVMQPRDQVVFELDEIFSLAE